LSRFPGIDAPPEIQLIVRPEKALPPHGNEADYQKQSVADSPLMVVTAGLSRGQTAFSNGSETFFMPI
jgi:hypothetical protein